MTLIVAVKILTMLIFLNQQIQQILSDEKKKLMKKKAIKKKVILKNNAHHVADGLLLQRSVVLLCVGHAVGNLGIAGAGSLLHARHELHREEGT